MKHLFMIMAMIFLFSCKKEEDKGYPHLTSNLVLNANPTVTMPVFPTVSYLKQFPYGSIKYTLDIVGYLVPTSDIGTQVYVLYNKLNARTSKLIYHYFKRLDGSTRHQIYSFGGILAFSIDIKKRTGLSDTLYNATVGQLPPISLGYYTTYPPLTCARSQGFGECYKCARDDCHDKWYCDFACALAHGACQAGWIVSCAIINIPHGPSSGGGRMGDTTLLRVYKLPINISNLGNLNPL